MAAADTARLVAQLTLDARGFHTGLSKAEKDLGHFESTAFRVGQNIGGGIKAGAANLAKIGVVALGGLALAVRSGLDDLSTLNSAIVSVDGAIASVGATGQITGKQVADWANQIESDIGAAFDDKDITAAAATLLRFGKVTPKNLRPALVVMTDLATKTGDIDSAASLLAKALADPTKAAGKLARAGIVLTKEQQKTIDAMVKQNDIAGAQQVILDALSKTTAGAAANSQDKYRRSISLLNDVAEDARKALAEGFLPVIQRVAELLSKKMQDPRFLQGIRDFGNTLAGGLDDLVSIAERLPWGAIGDSLKIAGAGAKAVLNAFVSLPPWVQTAVLTGWGLNKLTGGALSGIVGELAKGLVKGVLGINAGVVNINAANVTGGGGGPGGAAASALGGIGFAAAGAGAIGVTIVGVSQAAGVSLTQAVVSQITGNKQGGQVAAAVQQNVGGGPLQVFGPLQRLIDALGGDLRSPLEKIQDSTGETAANTKNVGERNLTKLQTLAANQVHTSERIDALRATQQQDTAAATARLYAGQQAAKAAQVQAQASAASSIKAAQDRTTAAAQASAAAIRAKKLSVNVENHNNIVTSVSVRETIKSQTTYKSYFKTLS